MTVSNDRCIHGPKSEPKDPDPEGNAYDITITDGNEQCDKPSTTVPDQPNSSPPPPHQRPTLATTPCQRTIMLATRLLPRLNRSMIHSMTTTLCRLISIPNAYMTLRLTTRPRRCYDKTYTRSSRFFHSATDYCRRFGNLSSTTR